MRAPPLSSSPRHTQCARITCEPARKLPRRLVRANIPSAALLRLRTRRQGLRESNGRLDCEPPYDLARSKVETLVSKIDATQVLTTA